MTTLLQIIAIVFAIFVAGGWLLRLADIALDREDREKFKARVEKFWMETANIGFTAKLRRALKSRYARTRSLRVPFLKIFLLICFLLAGISFVTTVYNAGGDGYLSKLVETNFDQRYRVHCAILLGQEKRADEEDAETFCDPANDHNEFKQLAQYRLQLAAYKALVTNLTEKRPHLLVALQALMAFLQIAIVAAPLSAALWLSFNITLRLLSRITASKLSLFLLVTLDVLVALLMPPLVTSFMTCVLVGGAVFAFGESPDFFAFQSANWFTLTVGGALFMTSFNFILPTLIALVALMLPTTWGILLAVAMLFIAPIIVAVYRGLEFFTDVGKVVGLDWGIGPISTAINWAIFLDLLFSITFLAPSLALVLANRNKSTRKIFLNFAMWIHDHQKGPFIAISEILTSIPKVFGGK